MNLGRFSVSLAVKDIKRSRKFYEDLGFEAYDDHEDEHWIIMRHGDSVVGLFQGMFDANVLTFNPTDVRSIQKELQSRGLHLESEADEATSGPASVLLKDPDGNSILIDQHDPAYRPTSAT